MTENTPGAAGNVPEHQPHDGHEGHEGEVPERQQPSEGAPPPAEEPSPWSAAGYQTYRPAEQPTAGYPNPGVPAYPQQPQQPSEHPGYPTTGSPESSGYPSAGSPEAPGYPTAGSPESGYPTAGQQEAPSGYPSSGVNFGHYPPLGGPQTATMPAAPPRERGGRRGALIAGLVVLVIVVGGAAGGLGAHLFGGSANGPVQSALSQPVPTANQASAPAGSVQAVANKVLPSVVEISVQVQSGQGITGDTGSGILISSDGQILTNNHVIEQAAVAGNGQSQIQVIFSNGKTVSATILGRDPTSDIAVIKAQGVSGLPVATLGTANNLQVGQEVVAIGAPYGLSGTVTSGIVSSLHRPTVAGDGGQGGRNAQTTVMDAIQTDAPINPGNSGGALVNMQGQVIGINSAIYSSPSTNGSQGGNVGIGFAIPIDQARRLANDIVKTGHSIQTVLGVEVTDNIEGIPQSQQGQLSQQQQAAEEQAGLTNGAYIVSVTSGGPADKAGLKKGSVVVKANGRLITSANGLVAAVHAAAPGDHMTLTLNDNSTVTVTLSGETVQTN